MTALKRIFIGIVPALIIIALVRFIAGEDSWMCEDGEWVKHGMPSEPAPTTNCP